MRSKISFSTASPVTSPPEPSWPVRIGCCVNWTSGVPTAPRAPIRSGPTPAAPSIEVEQ